MAYTDAQIRNSTQQTYEHVNATVYGGRLPAWSDLSFKVTDSNRTLGAVQFIHPRSYGFGPKVIGISISRYCNTLAVLANTVRHEIAHVASIHLDQKAGHGYNWQRHAVLCGAEPVRCNPHEVEPQSGDYVLTCGNESCGKTYLYKKRSKNVERAARGELRAKCTRCNSFSNFTAHRHI